MLVDTFSFTVLTSCFLSVLFFPQLSRSSLLSELVGILLYYAMLFFVPF
jgi:hypothetical protein